MAYISKIKVPGVAEAYLIKDNEGRLMIAPAYTGSTPADGSYYVKDKNLYKVVGSTGFITTVSDELQSIKQSISSAMHYIGITKTPLKDGSTDTTLAPLDGQNSLNKTTDFVPGDVVLAPAGTNADEMYYEYVWNKTQWSKFGSTKAIGSMAYANTATGSTTISYIDTKYTGGTVEVNVYSEGSSKYLKKDTVVRTVGVGGTTSASSVSLSASRLVTTSVGVVSGTGDAVTNITTTEKGLDTTRIYGVEETGAAVTKITTKQKGLGTTSICGVSGTGAAVTKITTTEKGLETTSIYGVGATAVVASKVSSSTTSIQVGASSTTQVINGLGSTAAASGSNPFVGATVGNDECLSWIEKPLTTTPIRSAATDNITVQKVTISDVTGLATKAESPTTVATGGLKTGATGIITAVTSTTDSFAKMGSSTTVATGGLVEGATGIITAVTSTTDSFAKKATSPTTVATGKLSDEGSGIITGVTSTTDSFAKKADSNVTVATGEISSGGSGDDVNEGISITSVTGLVTGITSSNNTGVLVEGTSGETGAIKVLSGINTGSTTKNVTLTKGSSNTEKVTVTIKVIPDK